VTIANDPNVLAIIIFLPIAAIDRNNAEATWPSSTNTRHCLKNLYQEHQIIWCVWKSLLELILWH
jgi:hypothetical protein